MSVGSPSGDATVGQERRILVGRTGYPFADLAVLGSRVSGAELDLVEWGDGTLPPASGFLGRPPAAALVAGAGIEWVHLWNAGVDKYQVKELQEAGITVTTSKGNGAVSIAEHALYLLLALQLGAIRWNDAQRAQRWDPHVHHTLAGTTCGIVGMGNIGSELAAILVAMGVRVMGLTRSGRSTVDGVETVGVDRMGWLLEQVDSLVMTAPLTPETRGMIGAAELARLRPGALYVCVSRGGIVDDAALLAALREGQLAGAGLDAHAVEPLPPDSPFWSLPNVIVTPHNGGTTPQTIAGSLEIVVDNLVRYAEGTPLRNVVSPQGY